MGFPYAPVSIVRLTKIDAAFLLGDHPELPKRLQPVVTAAVCGFLVSTADLFTI